MKPFDEKTKKQVLMAMAAWTFAALLTPNIMIVCQWHKPLLMSITNLLLPLGIYMLLLTYVKNRWLTLLWEVLFMAFCAFEMVLVNMYGPAPIGVDMFLNVVTTNTSEVGELLGNLKWTMLLIFVIYLPSLAFGVYINKERMSLPHKVKVNKRRITFGTLGAGLLLAGICKLCYPAEILWREIFPVNAVCNLALAVDRGIDNSRYDSHTTSFTYDATSVRPQDEKETYVVILGETTRADNWQIFGYNRPTTPELVANSSVIGFGKAMSQSNTTHKIVPMLLSPLDAENYHDMIYDMKSFITAFKDAGFKTYYFSNQGRNGAIIDGFGREADEVTFLRDTNPYALDGELLPLLKKAVTDESPKKLIVLHTYGSHYSYFDRYPNWCHTFGEDTPRQLMLIYREELIDNYDNSVLYTSHIIDQTIKTVGQDSIPSAVFYVGDHGEDIFDDERCRSLHSSPSPTFWQLHVPMLAWFSPDYEERHAEMVANARANKDKLVASNVALCHTLLQAAGINTHAIKKESSLVDSCYKEPKLLFLNDYNEAVTLEEAEFHKNDFVMLNKMKHPSKPR